MLLSIDRVLQLLAEGKPVEKIAEMAGCEIDNVTEIISQARAIISKYEKPRGRKKIIIKRNRIEASDEESAELKKIFDGSELSAVPVESSLVIFTDGFSEGNTSYGLSGIGIVILDKQDRQVGKVSSTIGNSTQSNAEFIAVIRALKIAIYFKTKSLKIRTDSDSLVRQINNEIQIHNNKVKKFCEEITALMTEIPTCKIEHVTKPLNDKAKYLAKQAAVNIPRQ